VPIFSAHHPVMNIGHAVHIIINLHTELQLRSTLKFEL